MKKKRKRKISCTTSIMAIDPGPINSGVICMEDGKVTLCDTEMPNKHVKIRLKRDVWDIVGCEGVENHGMTVGMTTFETCYMVGRIQQITEDRNQPFMLIYRSQVKMHICHSMQAKPKNIRQALLDMFPATGGGKTPQVGIKSNPGPLFGVATHAWSALAIAVYARDHMEC